MKLDFKTVYETSYANGDRTHVPEDPTYMAVDDLELLLEQNMLVARHRVHSMPVKMRAYSLPCSYEMGEWQKAETLPACSTNQDMEKELVDPANKYNR